MLHLQGANISYWPSRLSSTEIDDMLRKSTNLLLTRILSSCLQNLIKKPHIGLTEVGKMKPAEWSLGLSLTPLLCPARADHH